jgi:uncharacterized membrane protein YidH (DUF202 family)
MAWQRTSLAVAVSALAVVRLAVRDDSIAGLVVGSLVLASSAVTILRVRSGYNRMISEVPGTPLPRIPVGSGAATACSVALLGVAALLVLAL